MFYREQGKKVGVGIPHLLLEYAHLTILKNEEARGWGCSMLTKHKTLSSIPARYKGGVLVHAYNPARGRYRLEAQKFKVTLRTKGIRGRGRLPEALS